MQVFMLQLDTCLLLNLQSSSSSKIAALVQHACRCFQQSLLDRCSKLFYQKNLVIDQNQNSDGRSSQKHIGWDGKSLFLCMGLHGDKADLLSEHLNSDDFDFTNFDIFGSVLYFGDVIGELFADGNFLYYAVFDMLVGKHWNDSLFDGQFKSLYHELLEKIQFQELSKIQSEQNLLAKKIIKNCQNSSSKSFLLVSIPQQCAENLEVFGLTNIILITIKSNLTLKRSNKKYEYLIKGVKQKAIILIPFITFYNIKHQLRLSSILRSFIYINKDYPSKPIDPNPFQPSQIKIAKMQTNQTEVDEQQKAKRVQQKIKLMMKYKKMQKLTSEKDLASEKPISTFNDKASSKFDQISIKNKKHNFAQQNYREQQTFETFSTKRIKSINENDDMAPSSSINLKEQSKKFMLSNKERRLDESTTMKRIPSEQKLDKGEGTNRQSAKKLKRPSSVINKSTRATTSRTRKQKPLQPEDQKAMQQKIRQIIPSCFEYGIKLQKYADQKRINLTKEHQLLLSEQLNIIRLINNSRKYYVLKAQNEEEQDGKLSAGVQKEIIEMLKKKIEKEAVINKCSQITDQITKLIDARLSALNKTKIN